MHRRPCRMARDAALSSGPAEQGASQEAAMPTPGLIVAPLTPFTADLKVDEPALARQIDYVVKDCRATMVVAAGVETQEYTYLSLEQRKELIRRTIEIVDRPRAGDGRHLSRLVQDGDRACPRSRAAGRRRRAAPGAAAPVRRPADAGTISSPISRRSAARPGCRSRSISIPAPAPTSRSPTRSRSPSFRRCSSSRKARAISPACRG